MQADARVEIAIILAISEAFPPSCLASTKEDGEGGTAANKMAILLASSPTSKR